MESCIYATRNKVVSKNFRLDKFGLNRPGLSQTRLDKPVSNPLKAGRQKRRGRQQRTQSPNGFALEPVLILFLFTLLFSAWAALTIQSKAYLLQANRRSELDLAILERAKTIAGDLSWQRRCALDLDSTSRNETILDHHVSFRDQTTFLECSYTENGRKFVFDVYYDQTGIIKIEYRDRSS